MRFTFGDDMHTPCDDIPLLSQWINKRGRHTKKAPKSKKTTTLYRKGIEWLFALVYNLITTKNLHESEVIIHQ